LFLELTTKQSWGTTNLRIRLVSNDKFKIVKEKDYDLGLKKVNLIWEKYACAKLRDLFPPVKCVKKRSSCFFVFDNLEVIFKEDLEVIFGKRPFEKEVVKKEEKAKKT